MDYAYLVDGERAIPRALRASIEDSFTADPTVQEGEALTEHLVTPGIPPQARNASFEDFLASLGEEGDGEDSVAPDALAHPSAEATIQDQLLGKVASEPHLTAYVIDRILTKRRAPEDHNQRPASARRLGAAPADLTATSPFPNAEEEQDRSCTLCLPAIPSVENNFRNDLLIGADRYVSCCVHGVCALLPAHDILPAPGDLCARVRLPVRCPSAAFDRALCAV